MLEQGVFDADAVERIRAAVESGDEGRIIDLIFEKWFSSRYEESETHGLGLWLCRRIIEGYFGGTIRAEKARSVARCRPIRF